MAGERKSQAPPLEINELKMQDILQSRFRTGSLEESAAAINTIFQQVSHKYYDEQRKNNGETTTNLFDMYSMFARRLPYLIPAPVNQKAIDSIKEAVITGKREKDEGVDTVTIKDPEKYKNGSQILISLHLKSILGGLAPFLTDNPDTNNDLVQHVLMKINERAHLFRTDSNISRQMITSSRNAAYQFIMEEFGIPSELARRGEHYNFMLRMDDIFSNYPDGMGEKTIEENAVRLEEEYKKYGISRATIRSYIERRNRMMHSAPLHRRPDEADLIKEVERPEGAKKLTDVFITGLRPREEYVLRALYLYGLTQTEIADKFDLTNSAIDLIERNALNRLYHPSRRRLLAPLRDSLYDNPTVPLRIRKKDENE